MGLLKGTTQDLVLWSVVKIIMSSRYRPDGLETICCFADGHFSPFR